MSYSLNRFLLVLLLTTGVAMSQSAPAYIPSNPATPRQYANLTADRSTRLPSGWRASSDWGRTRRLAALTSRARPSELKPGLTPSGETRMLGDGVVDGWEVRQLPDGRKVWKAAIQSSGARGLRLHFRNFSVGRHTVWIYPRGSEHEAPSILGPFDQRGPNGDGDFWTGTVFGDTAVIEVESDSMTEAPKLGLDRIAHLYGEDEVAERPSTAVRLANPRFRGAGRLEAAPPAATATNGSPCHVDATCYPQYNSLASATLHFQFQSNDGFTYVCSGAMINTRTSSRKPYVATANHCISSDGEARSVEAYFQYASRSCNTTPVFREDAFRVSGARYLAGGGWSRGDFALLLLSNDPPAGTAFLGWNAAAMPFNRNFVGLHYPRGSWRRIAIGARTPDDSARISGELAPADAYYQMQYSLGLTESGSSGSPILSEDGQIFGTLSYGPVPPAGKSMCDFAVQTAAYGRFSSAYESYRAFLEEEAPPSLTLSTSSLTFQVDGGAVVGAGSATVTLRSTQGTAVAFSAVSSAAWLRVRASSERVSLSAPATLTIEVDPRTLTANGRQTANVTITSGTSVPLLVAVTVNVQNRASAVTVSVTPNPAVESAPDSDGCRFTFKVTVSETAGVATRLTTFSIDGTVLRQVSDWFGTEQLGANSTLEASLRACSARAPGKLTFVVGGTDIGTLRTWSRAVTVDLITRPSRGEIQLTSLPGEIQEQPGSADCSWAQYLVVKERNGYLVRLTRLVADGIDLSANLADFFERLEVKGGGATVGGICWTGIRAPATIELLVEGVDSAGNRVESRVTSRFVGPVADPAVLSTSASQVFFSGTPEGTQPIGFAGVPVQLNRSNAAWTASLVFAGPEMSWLGTQPVSGIGPGTISLSPTRTGITAGQYNATLFIESPQARPQTLAIPIQLTLRSGLLPVLSDGGVVPNATYRGALTPGNLASAFGQNLFASGSAIASSIPLPTVLGSTSVRVNGRLAPLLYAGNNQINFQVPWETATGIATLVVEVDGERTSTTFPVTNINPGIYTSDGRRLVPQSEAPRSGIILAFVGGVGLVSPAVESGNAPSTSIPVTGLPQPAGGVRATIGGVEARILFSAIPYGLVGLMQVNLEVPAAAPLGEQPLVISVGGNSSPPAYITVR